MAITYVGGTQAGLGTGNTTISLTTLTGGIASAPAANDIVVVTVAVGYVGDLSVGVLTSGYTEISELWSNDVVDTNLSVSTKIMGATPDTSVSVTGRGVTTAGGVAIVQVYRGVDLTTPLDVTPTTASTINTVLPNPPAITPVTSGALIVAIGAGAHTRDLAAFSASYLSNFSYAIYNSTQDITAGMGNITWTGGTYDPAIWTFERTDSVDYSNASVTIALRPAIDALTSTNITTGNPTLDTPTAADVSSGPTDLTATDTTTASPTLDTATLVATSILEAGGITTGSPTLDISTVAQTHVITSIDITSGTPVLDASTLTQIAGTDSLTSVGITTGAATLDTSDLSQKHILSAATLVTGAPTTGTTTLAQEHTLSSTNITTGAVSTGTPTLSRNINFTATNADTGIPELGTPSASIVSNLVATFVTAGIPTLAAATVGQGHALTSTSITAAAPVLTSATAFSQETFSESYERKRTVWVLADNRVVVVSKDVLPNVVTAEREHRTTTIQ